MAKGPLSVLNLWLVHPASPRLCLVFYSLQRTVAYGHGVVVISCLLGNFRYVTRTIKLLLKLFFRRERFGIL